MIEISNVRLRPAYGRLWTSAEDARVAATPGTAASIGALAEELGRGIKTVWNRRSVLRKKASKEAGQPLRKPWTVEEDAQLLRLRAEGKTFLTIAHRLGRRQRSCAEHYALLCGEPASGDYGGVRHEPPPSILAERDACLSYGHVSLTAAICGDPLPGRSALDRRRSP